MLSNNSHFLENVFQHLITISKGHCLIDEDVISNNKDELHQRILSGMMILHEDLRLSQEDLLQSKNELENKMALLEERNNELSRFTYVASHDLQEPLRTITSFIDLFKDYYDSKLDAQGRQFLQFIYEASMRMQALIKGLLDLSRIGANKVKSQLDCYAIVSDVLMDLRTSIDESGANLEVENLPAIIGFEVELRQLFQNLISNAIKFRKNTQNPTIKISAVEKTDQWLFKVEDDGIGIDMAHKDEIFDIFQRLHNREKYEGTGIGLAHCKKIVEMHGGDIWVDSRPGNGSTFYFTIPIEKHEEEVRVHTLNRR